MSLSRRLRDETHDRHRDAERRSFVRDLLGGRVDRAGYAALLRSLHVVYDALESAFDRAAPATPGLTDLAPAAVRRRQALAADLDVHHGPGWPALRYAPAADDWADRLRHLADEDPLLLAAHAYVRYLGDLSGGQMIGRRIAETFRIEGDRGLAFHRFPEVPDSDAFKATYRVHLDALAKTGRADDLVAEAQRAFGFAADLFDQVDGLRTRPGPGEPTPREGGDSDGPTPRG